MAKEKEIWKPVVGYEDWYEVSSLGRVRRIRLSSGERIERYMHPSFRRAGAKPTVTLYSNGKSVVTPLCNVVAEAFLGVNIDEVTIICKDGDNSNVAPNNLVAKDRELKIDGEVEWREIPGYDGTYEISNLGRVKSNLSKKILKQGLNGGYSPNVRLLSAGGKSRSRYICQLMVETFYDIDVEQALIDHIDGDPTNNLIGNLTYYLPGSSDDWRPIRGYEGYYEVSRFGDVRSMRGKQNKFRSGALKPFISTRWGYLSVDLRMNKTRKTRRVHQLVAEAFIGPCPDGMEINHIDGDKTNNNVDNLEYVSHSENVKHAFRAGLATPLSGEKNPSASLTKDDVLRIRKMIKDGKTNKEIAKMFGVTPTNIYWIRKGVTWANI